MAGTIITDFIRADANKLSLNVGNTIIASVNALGILSNTGNVLINAAGTVEGNNITYNGSTILSAGRVRNTLQPSGSVLQVVQAFKSDTFSTTTATWADITGLSAAITPTSSTSKILLMCSLGKIGTAGTSWYAHGFRFAKNGNGIGVADAAGSRPQATFTTTDYDANYGGGASFQYLDSPATTASITYSVQIFPHATSGITTYVNRGEGDQDSTGGYYSRSASSLILMEIAG